MRRSGLLAPRLVVAATCCAVVVASCSHQTRHRVVAPAPTQPDTSTAVVDYGTVSLPGVSGVTTSTLLTTGTAHLMGTVSAGLDGPVGAATVHVERLVAAAVISADVATRPDGTWALDLIPGGRYRVRAWRAPDLALVDPVVFFLGSDETRTVNLDVGRYTGTTVLATIAPNPPLVGQRAQLVVQVRATSVDGRGVVRAVPEPDVLVELSDIGSVDVRSANPQLTDLRGDSTWLVECPSTGPSPGTVLLGGSQSFPLGLPPCSQPPTTTTTAGVTTTSRGGAPPSTTSGNT